MVDKRELKRVIDSTKDVDMLITTISPLMKEGDRRVRQEMDRFLAKRGEYLILLIRR